MQETMHYLQNSGFTVCTMLFNKYIHTHTKASQACTHKHYISLRLDT